MPSRYYYVFQYISKKLSNFCDCPSRINFRARKCQKINGLKFGELDAIIKPIEASLACQRRVIRDLGGDHCFDVCAGDLVADAIGVIAAIGEEGLDPLANHPEQGCKALHITRLTRRQHEAERETPGIALGVDLGSEAAALSAERLRLPSPLFMPTAQ